MMFLLWFEYDPASLIGTIVATGTLGFSVASVVGSVVGGIRRIDHLSPDQERVVQIEKGDGSTLSLAVTPTDTLSIQRLIRELSEAPGETVGKR